ncbi:MAG: hypothetical protein EPN84_03035 [Legionella sp.]|nr:MAG: hypothetical protein EPN84_03035 [Legionella sp.]
MKKDTQSTTSQKPTSSKKSVKENTSENAKKTSPKMTATEKSPKKETKATATQSVKKQESTKAKATKKTDTAKPTKAASPAKASKEKGSKPAIVITIQEAVVQAEGKYREYHAPKENKASKNAARRNSAGFLNAIRQMERSLDNAQQFIETIQAQDELDSLVTEMRRFLRDASSSFYQHSFPSYLAAELADENIQIIRKRLGAHYEKQAVIRELNKWFASQKS